MKVIYTLIIIILIKLESTAQDSTSIVNTFIGDIKIGAVNSFSFFTAPVFFSTDEWLIASGITAGGLIMLAYDEKLEAEYPAFFARNKLFGSILGHYGDVDYANIFSMSLYAAGLLSGEDKLRITGRLLVESLFISGSAALLLRLLTGRPRPYMNENSSFQWFKTDLDYQSFPSGHTTVVFAVSTVLAERIDNNWARVGFYGLASLAAVERIYSPEHWFSDVIMGGLLGYGAASFVLNRENEREASSGSGISIYPSLGGMNLIWRF